MTIEGGVWVMYVTEGVISHISITYINLFVLFLQSIKWFTLRVRSEDRIVVYSNYLDRKQKPLLKRLIATAASMKEWYFRWKMSWLDLNFNLYYKNQIYILPYSRISMRGRCYCYDFLRKKLLEDSSPSCFSRKEYFQEAIHYRLIN